MTDIINSIVFLNVRPVSSVHDDDDWKVTGITLDKVKTVYLDAPAAASRLHGKVTELSNCRLISPAHGARNAHAAR